MIKELILVGTGGFAGSILRYLLSLAFMSASTRAGFPFGTFVTNASGALLIGFLFTALSGADWRILLMAGFCGGFTTFSAFSLDTLKLMREGAWANAAIYIAASVAVCLLFVWLGAAIGSRLAK